MKRYIGWCILGVLMVALLLFIRGCPQPPPVVGEFVDDLGRTVSIEKVPQRIVSLAPSNTEILFALGLGDKVVGVTEFCDYPEAAKAKPKIGGFAPFDLERVVALEPDLVLAADIHKLEGIPALEKLGITIFALAPETLDEVLASISLVGEITGKNQEANQLVRGLEERIKTITDKTEALDEAESPRVLYVVWHDPLWVAGSGTLADNLINNAGGKNIAHDLVGHKTIDIEMVIHRNPQVIIVTHGVGAAVVKNEPRLAVTDAARENRVYQVEEDPFSRAGPRMIDALEELARIIHPKLFGE